MAKDKLNNNKTEGEMLASIAKNSAFVASVFSLGKDTLIDGSNNINLIGKVSPAYHAKWKLLLRNLASSLKNVNADVNIKEDKIFVNDLDIKANIVIQNNKVGWLNHTVTCATLTGLLVKETRHGMDALMIKVFSDDQRFIIGKSDETVATFWTKFDEQVVLLSKQTAVAKIKEITALKIDLDEDKSMYAVMDSLPKLNDKEKASNVQFTFLRGALLFELMLADRDVYKVFRDQCCSSSAVLSNKMISVFTILSSMYDILVDSRSKVTNGHTDSVKINRHTAASSVAIVVK